MGRAGAGVKHHLGSQQTGKQAMGLSWVESRASGLGEGTVEMTLNREAAWNSSRWWMERKGEVGGRGR